MNFNVPDTIYQLAMLNLICEKLEIQKEEVRLKAEEIFEKNFGRRK